MNGINVGRKIWTVKIWMLKPGTNVFKIRKYLNSTQLELNISIFLTVFFNGGDFVLNFY